MPFVRPFQCLEWPNYPPSATYFVLSSEIHYNALYFQGKPEVRKFCKFCIYSIYCVVIVIPVALPFFNSAKRTTAVVGVVAT